MRTHIHTYLITYICTETLGVVSLK